MNALVNDRECAQIMRSLAHEMAQASIIDEIMDEAFEVCPLRFMTLHHFASLSCNSSSHSLVPTCMALIYWTWYQHLCPLLCLYQHSCPLSALMSVAVPSGDGARWPRGREQRRSRKNSYGDYGVFFLVGLLTCDSSHES